MLMDINPRLVEASDCLYRVAVKAVIIDNSQVLLVKEDDDEWWSLPGGGIDYGETILDALARELNEELGVPQNMVQTNGNILFVTIGAVVDNIPRANLFYRVDIPKGSMVPTKHVKESRWFEFDELASTYMSPSTGDIRSHLDKLINI
jgi:8-oxo-dGTP diphosphatase